MNHETIEQAAQTLADASGIRNIDVEALPRERISVDEACCRAELFLGGLKNALLDLEAARARQAATAPRLPEPGAETAEEIEARVRAELLEQMGGQQSLLEQPAETGQE